MWNESLETTERQFSVEGAKKKQDLQKTEEAIRKAFERIRSVLGVELSSPKICLYYKRTDYDQAIKWPREGRSPRWMSGTATIPENKISIFAPSVYAKETSHREEEFPLTLCHELSHLAQNVIAPVAWPKWLGEGLSYYVSQQEVTANPLYLEEAGICRTLDTPTNWKNNSHYSLAAMFVKFLIGEYGLDKVLTLCRSLEKHYKFAHFAKTFQRVFGVATEEVEESFLQRLNSISEAC